MMLKSRNLQVHMVKQTWSTRIVNPSADDNFAIRWAIRWASENGCTEVVKVRSCEPVCMRQLRNLQIVFVDVLMGVTDFFGNSM